MHKKAVSGHRVYNHKHEFRAHKFEKALRYLRYSLEYIIQECEEKNFILIPDTSMFLIFLPYKNMNQYYSNPVIKRVLGSETSQNLLEAIKDMLDYRFTFVPAKVEEEVSYFGEIFTKWLKQEYYGPVVHSFMGDWIRYVKRPNNYSNYMRNLLKNNKKASGINEKIMDKSESGGNIEGDIEHDLGIETVKTHTIGTIDKVVEYLLGKYYKLYGNDALIMADAIRALKIQFMNIALITTDHHFSYMAKDIKKFKKKITKELIDNARNLGIKETPAFNVVVFDKPEIYIKPHSGYPKPENYFVVQVIKSKTLE